MHVAVLGAGYAGVSLVRKLEQSLAADVEITLVDEKETHLVQHLIHRTIRKPSLEDNLSVPIADILTRANHRQARVEEIDCETGDVILEDGQLPYDVGAVCLGGQTAFYNLPGVRTHATPLKRLSHAAEIRDGFSAVRNSGGRALVAGAGLSGIQVAGELAELAATAASNPAVVLLEQRERVAPSFPDRFQQAVRETLDEAGIDVRTGARVIEADEETVTLDDGTTIAYDQFIWTGGIAGQEAVSGERPIVRADLRLGNRTVALGDAVRVIDSEGSSVPATAQTAVREADVAATNIRRLLDYVRNGRGFEPRLARYRYESLGWIVSVGDDTVAQVGPSILRGPSARAVKTTVGAGYLSSVGAIENAVEYVHDAVKK